MQFSTINSSVRRRNRRRRAFARLQVWKIKTGQLFPDPPLVQRLYSQLSTHHSKDTRYLRNFLNTANSIHNIMEQTGPWRCLPCKRLCKATAHHCPQCGQKWQTVIDRSYVPNQTRVWDWPEQSTGRSRKPSPRARQEGRGERAPSTERSSSRRRRQADGKGGKKGKGRDPLPEGGGSYALPPAPPAPWLLEQEATTHGPTSQPTSSSTTALAPDVIAAIRRAFPDASQMPGELKQMIDKNDQQQSRPGDQRDPQCNVTIREAQEDPTGCLRSPPQTQGSMVQVYSGLHRCLDEALGRLRRAGGIVPSKRL